MNLYRSLLLSAMVITLASGCLARSVGGKKSIATRIEGRSTVRFQPITFRAGERAWVMLKGDGDTDLDLYVYDANDREVARDDDSTDRCVVSWTPKWTGRFTIVVRNRGIVYNRYVLVTN